MENIRGLTFLSITCVSCDYNWICSVKGEIPFDQIGYCFGINKIPDLDVYEVRKQYPIRYDVFKDKEPEKCHNIKLRKLINLCNREHGGARDMTIMKINI